jgi:hypothetical protein
MAPVPAARIAQLAGLIDRTISEAPHLALERILEMLSAVPTSLGSKPLKDSSRAHYSTFRRAFEVLPDDAARGLLAAIPSAPEQFDRVLVDAAFAASASRFTSEMNTLLGDSRVSGTVRGVIRKNKAARERTLGSSAWPEILLGR